ncbi:4443_t:CDS:10 [Rhizophagus irregularis]|nr:4443_t:CDS:10 [Rhizophagus irregularis]
MMTMRSNCKESMRCILFIYLLLHLIVLPAYVAAAVEYRSLDGSNNNIAEPKAGTPNVPFFRQKPHDANYAGDNSEMVSSPGNYNYNPNEVVPKCKDLIPKGMFPLPRCISDVLDGYQTTAKDAFSWDFIDSFKSKRKVSHMITFWGQFMAFDIASSQFTGENLPTGIIIPSDDAEYLSSISGTTAPLNENALAFNRSNPKSRQGTNGATSFVDASTIYGIDQTKLEQELRDFGNRGKLKLRYTDTPDGQFGYPPTDANGDYILGFAPKRSANLFTHMIHTIFLREHNRRCDELYAIHQDEWDDEMYFQEARRWVIALIQKITYREYLSIILGAPLLPYTKYNPDLVPGLETFFTTVTMKYGHSEVSDFYTIVDNDGQVLNTLPLSAIQTPLLMESFNIPVIASSLSLQRQEEVDIFYTEMMRGFRFPTGDINDIASIDHLRVRDRGIPLYNDVRDAYGLPRVEKFSDITNNTVAQARLQETYSTVDSVEALVGALAEDHLVGSNFGPLILASMKEQINNITWRDVLTKNVPASFSIPGNLWFVQPVSTFGTTNIIDNPAPDYPRLNFLRFSDVYEIRWKIDGDNIQFLLTMLSNNAWFGLGFNSDDNGMIGADIVLARTVDSANIEIANYKSAGYQPPVKDEKNQFIKLIRFNVSSVSTQVEFSRPLAAPDRRPITNNPTTLIYAWNPGSNGLSYHGGNRGSLKINFFSSTIAQSAETKNKLTRLLHGLAMFVTWSVLFPLSVFIVRYWKHVDTYLFQHRNMQIVGGVSVSTFGAAAMATADYQKRSIHGLVGISIYTIVFAQIGLGFIAIWGLAHLESANRGIMRGIRMAHFILGSSLIIVAWVNIYLGIIQFGGNMMWRIAYLIWIAFIGGEYWYNFRNGNYFYRKSDLETKQKRIHEKIPADVYERLPVVTWDDVNTRIASGAQLVVAEGLLFDIRKWSKFTFDQKDSENRHSMIQYNTLKKYDDTSSFDDSKQKKAVLKRRSIANVFDVINSSSFKNSRVATHHHSTFATTKLASMVIAKVNEYSDDLHKIQQVESEHNPHVFKRYILVNKEIVSRSDARRPVIKLTFQVINYEQLPEFLPGDYIEILCHIKGQVLLRSYTPLQSDKEKCFSIIIRVYEEGLMSRHLMKQLVGFEIKVRGPFDIRGTGITPMLQLIKYHLNYLNQSPNRNFKLFLLFANETISDIFYFKYLEHLVAASNGKLKITYILTRPPSNWEELSGHINEDILCKWLSNNYIPDGLDQVTENENSTYYMKRYMQALIQDSKHTIKLITCGPPLMIDSIEESLNNIGFPINDKAIFIR